MVPIDTSLLQFVFDECDQIDYEHKSFKLAYQIDTDAKFITELNENCNKYLH